MTTPDYTKFPLLDNMANIDKLDRQVDVRWPEFSWLSGEDESSRRFTMFPPSISRIGYTNEGRVYSIICPQQGVHSANYGNLNIEITVTSQRGWVDESDKNAAAELTVEPKLWFSPGVVDYIPFEIMAAIFERKSVAFPYKKSDAIRVKTYRPEELDNPVLKGWKGLDKRFDPPDFTRHPEAWSVSNLALGVGPQFKTGCEFFDDFSEMVMGIFNVQSQNLLRPGNTVSWNVWFTAPTDVDHCEWYRHADLWRRSLDTGHGPAGTATKDRNGKVAPLPDDALEQEILYILQFLAKYLPHVEGLDAALLRKLHDYLGSTTNILGKDMESEFGALLRNLDDFLHRLEKDAESLGSKMAAHFGL